MFRRIHKTKAKEQGMIIILALIFMAVLLAMSAALVGYSTVQIKAGRIDVSAQQALALAEAGLDNAISKLNQGTYNGETATALGAGMFTVTISTLGTGNKLVTSIGYIPDNVNPIATRTVKAQININSSTVAFNFGLQVGAGGLDMSNNAAVNGNIYSNGDITGQGPNNSSISGTAIVATGSSATPDVQWSNQNTDFNLGIDTAHFDAAQSFSPTVSSTLTKVSFYVKKVGNPSDLSIRIMTDSSGSPSKTTLAQGTLLASNVTGNYGWIDGSLNSVVNLTAGTKYWLMLVDPSASSSNYYIWGLDNTDGYASQTGKYSTNWNATTPVWIAAGGDFDFSTYMGGTTHSISGVAIGGDARAHSMSNCTVQGNAYFVSNSCTVAGTLNSNQPDQPPLAMPISDAQIANWEAAAAAGQSFSGAPYFVTTDTTIGPAVINGDFEINNGVTLTIAGPIWVKGNMKFDNDSIINLSASLGDSGTVMIADNPGNTASSGLVTFQNNVQFNGNGNPDSFPMVLSTSSNNNAVVLSNNVQGAVFYASQGTINVANNVQAEQLTGYRIQLSNNAIITYKTGLANAGFANGPGGAWRYSPGSYVIVK